MNIDHHNTLTVLSSSLKADLLLNSLLSLYIIEYKPKALHSIIAGAERTSHHSTSMIEISSKEELYIVDHLSL